MRVHQLALTAFGPFATRIDVDLDEVGRDGLFLLWGPTGAGKTTLLDAVVFALYGTVPGARGEEKRLRSDHAADDVRTEVELELTLGGERLRVTRRPEQQRPKRRGEGWTTEQARLILQRLSGEGWEPVSTRIDEGSEYLRTRLGLSAEQFCQVVLLPQGDFARFLRAEPEDRGRLLRTLFDVGRFARVEDWLVGERTAARERLDRIRARTGTLVSLVAQAADVTVPEEFAPELVGAAPGSPVTAWVRRIRAVASDGAARAQTAADAAGEHARAQEAALADARAEEECHARRDRARAELSRLEVAAPRLQPVRAALDAARRAEPVRDVLEAAGRAALEAERATDALGSARAAWAEVAAGREADATLARALRDEAAALGALLPEVERARRLEHELAAGERSVEELGERCLEAERAMAAWPARLQEQQGAVDAAAHATARLPGLGAAVTHRRTALEAARATVSLEAALTAERAAADAAREAWLDARERWNDLRTQRLDGMAAELAAGLVDGSACPVCGAAEHPSPAQPGGPLVTRDDEDAARVAAERAEARWTAARETCTTTERELAARRAQAGPEHVAAQEAELADLVAEQEAVQVLADGLGAARAVLDRSRVEKEAGSAALAADREELGRREAGLAAVRSALADVTTQLVTARGDDADLPARIDRLTAEAQTCEALVEAAAVDGRARLAEESALAVARARVEAAGFPDLDAAARALLPPGRADDLARQVEEHDRALAVVTGVLAEPQLAELAARPDLEALGAACRAATADREAAVSALEHARRRVARLDELAGELTAAEVELDEQRALTEQVTSLADLATGRGANRLKMRLQSFVLAARLEQVSEVASRRLQDMSGGRYTFLHSDAQGRHGARGGLGLEVLDEYTGTRRPTKTLSGGESFMASLALALGLADVVTAESGGVQIDSLFVDEGFGTLDPQALDAVMDVLDELRRGGRTVGLISHVEELRTRIASRLEVVPGRSGSRLAG
ncbi:SMC family ATPase [Blastococcus goldschmidtiae]|uniref:Nuclease SbcCD subunit C n=1 Tax=Blastococcus goldschmidtiae TaxID=3075546 RepID=A0ABU2K4L9_9ACTN|nr:SMC family ATPase [Blastococcus sp. DSM 46792]MDT0275101.1 SMC family ATPase [Blastococcus sp. DSM 46792]